MRKGIYIGTIHILRNHERGGRGVGQMLTFDYEGGRGGIGSWLRNHVILWKSGLKKNLAKKFRAPRIFSFKDFDYRTGTIITHGLYLLNPLFEGKNHFSRRFFEKILPFIMVSIQERFVIKSKLWWRAYGILHLYRYTSVVIKKSSNDNFFVQSDEVFTQTPLFEQKSCHLMTF